jgi:hypothetical protein
MRHNPWLYKQVLAPQSGISFKQKNRSSLFDFDEKTVIAVSTILRQKFKSLPKKFQSQ